MIHALLAPLVLAGPRAVCAVPAPQAAQPAAQQAVLRPEYRPAPGLVLTKEYTFEHVLALLEMSFTDQNGAQSSQTGMDLRSTFRWNARDHYLAFANGRTTLLEREFPPSPFQIELGKQRADGKIEVQTFDGGTPLAGSSVRFTWIEEESAYGRLYTKREAAEEYLENLAEASDCLAFLPPLGARVEQPWSIEPAQLASVFSPGGGSPMRFGRGADNPFSRAALSGIGGPLSEIVKGQWSGRVTARLVRPGCIALDLDVTVVTDLAEWMTPNLGPKERISETRVVAARATWSFKGPGELVWNDALHTPQTLELSGSESIANEITLLADGSAAPSKTVLRWSGGLKLSARFLTPEMVNERAAKPR